MHDCSCAFSLVSALHVLVSVCVLRAAKVIQFSQLVSLLDATTQMKEVLELLPQFAWLVRGCWVVKRLEPTAEYFLCGRSLHSCTYIPVNYQLVWFRWEGPGFGGGGEFS